METTSGFSLRTSIVAMIPQMNTRCCCLLLLLFHNIAIIDVYAFNNDAVASVSMRQTATKISAPKTSSVALSATNSTNVWFDLVKDRFTFSDKGTSKNANSKRDVMEILEEADVGQDLLDEVTMFQEADNAIVELPVMFAGEMDSSFDFERWELHRSPQRYGRLLLGLFSGVTTRRIFPTVLFLVAWSALIQFYNTVENFYGLPELELPLTPFELAAPVLGLLLVFRSNTAFERFNVGSDASWEITGRFRSVIRQLLSFSANTGRFSSKERVAAYDLVDACMVLHSWILSDYLQSPNTNRNTEQSSAKQSKILQKALQFSVVSYDDTMEFLEEDSSSSSTAPRRQRLQQTPSGLINIVTTGVCSRMPSLDPQESVMIEEQFAQVISSLGTCEKLIRTPIPLGYTRYAVRFTMIWLTLLPLALVRSFDGFSANTWWEGKLEPNLTISMLFLSVVFLSIEDISVQLEEPFSVLPLDLHNKWLKKDYIQMKRTSRLVDGLDTDGMEQRLQHEQESIPKQETIPKEKDNKRSRFIKLIRHGHGSN